MQHRHINLFLIILLAAVCVLMTVNLISLYRTSAYLPAETVESIVSVLASDNIRIDPDIIPTKREFGTVYVCNSEDYNSTVAQLLGASQTKAEYIIPDGSILILENGARLEFGKNFSFRFDLDGSNDNVHDLEAVLAQADEVGGDARREVERTVTAFLDRGSREFDSANMSIVTVVDSVVESGGKYYTRSSRIIDGVAVTDNYAICTVIGGEVTEAEGTWSFLTLGDSYGTQLSDLFNILFHVRSEIAEAAGTGKTVTITSIDHCYSFYYFGGDGDFCLIPCWQIATDSCGSFIYNAIDSTLYTINQ